MEHRLPRVPVAVQHQPISFIGVAAIFGDLGGCKKESTDARSIRRREIVHSLHVVQWNEKHMGGGLRADVFEPENLVVAVNDSRWKVAIPDFTKGAVVHVSQLRQRSR